MAEKPVRKKKFIRKLKKHYRLVIMNDDNFEIKASIKLTPLNVLFVVSSLSVLFAIIIISLLVFTPMKEYIMGENNENELRRDLIEMKFATDSLRDVIGQQEQYIDNVTRILRGDVDTSRTAFQQSKTTYDTIDLTQSSLEDSLLRMEMESMEGFGILATNEQRKITSIEEYYFFPPLKGIVTSEFNSDQNHYGIDIVAEENSSIKATLQGRVIFTGWTITDGYVIAIQHNTNVLSIYKHNSVLLKKVGNLVKAGDVIAIIGNSGELSQGPHLHFELWHDMIPVNPKTYINFNN